MAGELQNYIKQMHEQGFRDEKVKEELLKAGWSKDMIDTEVKAFAEAAGTPPAKTPPVSEPLKKSKNFLSKKALYLIIGGAVLLVAAGAAGALYSDYWNPSWDPFGDKLKGEVEEQKEFVSPVLSASECIDVLAKHITLQDTQTYNSEGPFYRGTFLRAGNYKVNSSERIMVGVMGDFNSTGEGIESNPLKELKILYKDKEFNNIPLVPHERIFNSKLWCFRLSEDSNTLEPGDNQYKLEYIFENGEKRSASINVAYEKETKEDIEQEQVVEEIKVEWLKEPVKLEITEALASFASNYLTDAEFRRKEDSYSAKKEGDTPICLGSECLLPLFDFGFKYKQDRNIYEEDPFEIYYLGDVAEGKYENGKVYFIDSYGGGHCSPCARYRMVLMPDGKLVLLQKYSNNYSTDYEWKEDYFAQFIEVDTTTEVPDLYPPKEINIEGSDINLTSKYTPHLLFSEWGFNREGEERTSVLFEDPKWGPMYIEDTFFSPGDNSKTPSGTFAGDMAITMPDTSIFQYSFDLSFLITDYNKDSGFIGLGVESAGELKAQFEDSGNLVAPGESFNAANGSTCGGGSVGYRINNDIEITDDFPRAKTSNGQVVYVLNFDHPYLQEIFDSNPVYKYQNEDATYEGFISITPIVFWEDPFGRLIELRNNEALSAAECGGGIPKSPLEPR